MRERETNSQHDEALIVQFVQCQIQRGPSDCGLFALAFSSSLCEGVDPGFAATYVIAFKTKEFPRFLREEERRKQGFVALPS